MRKKRGRGPKPKDQRRKRNKKEVIPETPKVQPPKVHIEQIEWKTRTPSHTKPGERRNPNSRIWNRDNYLGQRIEKPLQPMDRSIEEVVIGSLNLRPSAPIPYQKFRNEKKLKNTEVKFDMEKLEKHEKKLVLIIVRLDRLEEKIDKTVKKLDLKLTEFDSKLQAFSTLTAHMEKIMQGVRR